MAAALITSPDPVYTDREYEVYAAMCTTCEYRLEWAIVTPPIPLTLYRWFDPNGEGVAIEECPRCGTGLPEGAVFEPAGSDAA